MLPGLDPKKMQAVMKQMGISQTEIDSSRVIIEKTDGGKIIIDEPSVTKIKMQGQESFQIAGNIREQIEKYNQEDIQAVIEKTGVSKKEAERALGKTQGDLAEAILDLS